MAAAVTRNWMAVDAARFCLDLPAETARAMRDYERRIRKGPKEFGWFIERMTQPAIRELFMHPGNPLRTREAVMSILAGDIYRGTPYRPSLLAFKSIYYMSLMKNPFAALRNWLDRKIKIQDWPLVADAG